MLRQIAGVWIAALFVCIVGGWWHVSPAILLSCLHCPGFGTATITLATNDDGGGDSAVPSQKALAGRQSDHNRELQQWHGFALEVDRARRLVAP